MRDGEILTAEFGEFLTAIDTLQEAPSSHASFQSSYHAPNVTPGMAAAFVVWSKSEVLLTLIDWHHAPHYHALSVRRSPKSDASKLNTIRFKKDITL